MDANLLVVGENKSFSIESDTGPSILRTFPDFYALNFYEKPHFNWISSRPAGTSIISVLRTPIKDNSQTPNQRQTHEALLTSPERTVEFLVGIDVVDPRMESKLRSAVSTALKAQGHKLKSFVNDAKFPDELTNFEKTYTPQKSTMKVGVLYVKKGQLSPHRGWFDNGKDGGLDPRLKDLMSTLGTKAVINKDWNKFRGEMRDGLAFYNEWKGTEIIFHLSMLLPADEVRRLVGNDICILLFLEEDAQVHLSSLSELGGVCQIFVMVRPIADKWRLTFVQRSEIQDIGPCLEREIETSELGDLIITRFLNGCHQTQFYPPLDRLFRQPRASGLEELVAPYSVAASEYGFDPVAELYLNRVEGNLNSLSLLGSNSLSSINTLKITKDESFDVKVHFSLTASVSYNVTVGGPPATCDKFTQIVTRDTLGRIVIRRTPINGAYKETIIWERDPTSGGQVHTITRKRSGDRTEIVQSRAFFSYEPGKKISITKGKQHQSNSFGISLNVGVSFQRSKFVETVDEAVVGRTPWSPPGKSQWSSFQETQLASRGQTGKIQTKLAGTWKPRHVIVSPLSTTLISQSEVLLDFREVELESLGDSSRRKFDIVFRRAKADGGPVILRFETATTRDLWLENIKEACSYAQVSKLHMPDCSPDAVDSSSLDSRGFLEVLLTGKLRAELAPMDPLHGPIIELFELLTFRMTETRDLPTEEEAQQKQRIETLARTLDFAVLFGDINCGTFDEFSMDFYTILFPKIYLFWLRYNHTTTLWKYNLFSYVSDTAGMLGFPWTLYLSLVMNACGCLKIEQVQKKIDESNFGSSEKIEFKDSDEVQRQFNLCKETFNETNLNSLYASLEQVLEVHFSGFFDVPEAWPWCSLVCESADEVVKTNLQEVIGGSLTIVFVSNFFGSMTENVGTALQSLSSQIHDMGAQLIALATNTTNIFRFRKTSGWTSRVFLTEHSSLDFLLDSQLRNSAFSPIRTKSKFIITPQITSPKANKPVLPLLPLLSLPSFRQATGEASMGSSIATESVSSFSFSEFSDESPKLKRREESPPKKQQTRLRKNSFTSGSSEVPKRRDAIMGEISTSLPAMRKRAGSITKKDSKSNLEDSDPNPFIETATRSNPTESSGKFNRGTRNRSRSGSSSLLKLPAVVQRHNKQLLDGVICVIHPSLGIVYSIPSKDIDLTILMKTIKRLSKFSSLSSSSHLDYRPVLSLTQESFFYYGFPTKTSLRQRSPIFDSELYRAVFSTFPHHVILTDSPLGPTIILLETSKLSCRRTLIWNAQQQHFFIIPYPFFLHTKTSVKYIFTQLLDSFNASEVSLLLVTEDSVKERLDPISKLYHPSSLTFGVSVMGDDENQSNPNFLEFLSSLGKKVDKDGVTSYVSSVQNMQVTYKPVENGIFESIVRPNIDPIQIVLKRSKEPLDPLTLSPLIKVVLIFEAMPDGTFKVECVSKELLPFKKKINRILNNVTLSAFASTFCTSAQCHLLNFGSLCNPLHEIRLRRLEDLFSHYGMGRLSEEPENRNK